MVISLLIMAAAAIISAFRDRWMELYQQLDEQQEMTANKNWFCYHPIRKWVDHYGGQRANNFLLNKVGIKTTLFVDNCNDGWHLFKSVEISLYCLAACFYNPILGKGLDFLMLGATWVLFFDLTLYLVRKRIDNSNNYKY